MDNIKNALIAILQDSDSDLSKNILEMIKSDNELLFIALNNKKYYSLVEDANLTNEELNILLTEKKYDVNFCEYVCKNKNFNPTDEQVLKMVKSGVISARNLIKKTRLLITNPNEIAISLDNLFTGYTEFRKLPTDDCNLIIDNKIKRMIDVMFEKYAQNINTEFVIDFMLLAANKYFSNEVNEYILKKYKEKNIDIPICLKGLKNYQLTETEKIKTLDIKNLKTLYENRFILSNPAFNEKDLLNIFNTIAKLKRQSPKYVPKLLFYIGINENCPEIIKKDIKEQKKDEFIIEERVIVILDFLNKSNNIIKRYIEEYQKYEIKKLGPKEQKRSKAVNIEFQSIIEGFENTIYIDIEDYLQKIGVTPYKFNKKLDKIKKQNQEQYGYYLRVLEKKSEIAKRKYDKVIETIDKDDSITNKHIALYKYVIDNKLGINTLQKLLKANYFYTLNQDDATFIEKTHFGQKTYKTDILSPRYKMIIKRTLKDGKTIEEEVSIETRLYIVEQLEKENIPVVEVTFKEMYNEIMASDETLKIKSKY